jgi:large subunit ribosomal protein L15
MDLSNLKPADGSVRNNSKRLGRGQGSGKGGTAARGHKGAKSRSGYSRKIGFEGGQMPLQRRVPKFGFTNINRKEFAGVNLDTLQELVDAGKLTDTVDIDVLIANRIVGKND